MPPCSGAGCLSASTRPIRRGRCTWTSPRTRRRSWHSGARGDRRRIGEAQRLDDVLDKLDTAIKAYLTALDPEARAAASLLVTGDVRVARLPAAEKEAFRDMEAQAMTAHFERLRVGRTETAETSALHPDILRDLKRVNTHLVAAAACPVLEGKGELLPSRPRQAGADGEE